MTRLDNESYYDDFSTLYEKERHKRYHRFLDTSELDIARPYVQGKRVLELGCGTGLVLEPLSKMAARATGLDISRGMLQKAIDRGLDAVQASGTDIPFPDETFDCIVSFKVLAHIEQIEKTMQECARVLKPGGHLVLEFYNKHSLRQMVKLLKPAHKVATQTTDDQVYTRYDSLADIKGYLPPEIEVVDVAGIRCLAPTYHFFNAPVLGPVTEFVERAVQQTPIGRIGGFLVVIARKTG
jgi:ubiquinone/menaquinone biosynthesis C-methylase UbiE